MFVCIRVIAKTVCIQDKKKQEKKKSTHHLTMSVQLKSFTDEELEEIKQQEGNEVMETKKYVGQTERYSYTKLHQTVNDLWAELDAVAIKKLNCTYSNIKPSDEKKFGKWLFGFSENKDRWCDFRRTYPMLFSLSVRSGNVVQNRELINLMLRLHKQKEEDPNFQDKNVLLDFIKSHNIQVSDRSR